MNSRRCCCLLLLAILATQSVNAESAPLLMNFQGRLTNNVGSPVTATTAIRLSLIQDDGITEVIVYEEDASVTPDANGVFGHVIGTGAPVGVSVLEETDFITNGAALYVEVSIGGTPLLPRTRILSTGYAIEASRLDGKSADDIIGQSGGNAFVNEFFRHGANLEWQSATQINVRPGALGFSDAKVRKTGANVTWDFANPPGPLGLDVGVEASDTWYYLYAVPDPGDDSVFTVVASAAAPTQVGGAGPEATSYPTHRFIGSFFNDGNSDIRQFFRSGDNVFWGGNVLNWVSLASQAQPASTVDQWTTIDASAAMPETSRAVMLNGYYRAGGAARFLFKVATVSGGVSSYFCGNGTDEAATCDLWLPTLNRTFAYTAVLQGANDPNQSTFFSYRGHKEDLGEF